MMGQTSVGKLIIVLTEPKKSLLSPPQKSPVINISVGVKLHDWELFGKLRLNIVFLLHLAP
jgi:hypothetical protein